MSQRPGYLCYISYFSKTYLWHLWYLGFSAVSIKYACFSLKSWACCAVLLDILCRLRGWMSFVFVCVIELSVRCCAMCPCTMLDASHAIVSSSGWSLSIWYPRALARCISRAVARYISRAVARYRTRCAICHFENISSTFREHFERDGAHSCLSSELLIRYFASTCLRIA